MSDLNQSQLDEIQSSIDGINRDLMRISQMGASGPAPQPDTKTRTVMVATATRLKMESKALFQTMQKGTGSLSSYSGTVTGATGAVSSMLSSFGTLGKVIGMTIEIVGKLATRFLDGSQAILKSFDSLEAHGMTLGLVPTELRRQAHASKRFHSQNIEQFTAALQKLGGASLYLGGTTAQGASEFNKLTAVSDKVYDQFVMLGVEPAKLREHFATYIETESKLGFQRYRGAISEQQRAVNFAKNLYAMSALTGESVEELQQKYQSLRNDIQFNAKLTQLRAQGKTQQADNIDRFLTMVTSVMGESTAKAYKDLLVNNGAALVKESQGEVAATFGEAFSFVRSLMTDPNADPAEIITRMIKQKRESFEIFSPALQYGTNEDASALGHDPKAVAAAMTYTGDKSLKEMLAEADAVAKSGDKLSGTRAAQLKMEAKANIALDELSTVAEKPMTGAFTVLYNTVKIAAKVFAWGAGVFGFKDLEKKVADLFVTPEELQQKATQSTDAYAEFAAEIGSKQANIDKLRRELDDKRKSGKHTEEQLNVLEKKITDEETAVEKMRIEQVKLESDMREAWKKYGQTTEGLEYANNLNRSAASGVVGSIADVIGHYESGSDGYSALVGKQSTLKAAEHHDKQHGTNFAGEISQFLANIQEKTVAEVLVFQRKINDNLKVGTAIGRYQYIYKTLEGITKQMSAMGALSMSDKFNAATQDKILMFHLDTMGFKKVRAGTATEEDKKAFATRISGTWAGIGKDATDKGTYDGTNGNKAGKGSYAAITAAINAVTVAPKKFKIGGIASGPKSGYDVELHGTEAVVPMSGSTLPVLMNFPAISAVEIATPKFTADTTRLTDAVAKIKKKKETPAKPVSTPSKVKVSNAAMASSLETLLSLVTETVQEIDKSTNALSDAAKHLRV